MQVPFVGQTYTGRSINFDSSRCINFFLEMEDKAAKYPAMLVGTPGSVLFATIGIGTIRGMHEYNSGAYVVAGNQLHFVSSSGVVSGILGTLNTNTGQIAMEDNGIGANGVGGNQLIILDGVNGYIYNILTNVFEVIPQGANNFPSNPTQVTCLDGYFIITNDSMTFWCSDIFAGDVYQGLSFASANAAPDNIQTPVSLFQQLILIKENTTEFWYDAGVATLLGCPFQRYPAAVYDFGTPAPNSVARGNNTIFFLSTQRTANGSSFIGVAELNGYQPVPISTPAITYFISQSTDISQCFGYCYSEDGHTFYVLTNPIDNWTLVYDATMKSWHEWSYYSGDPNAVNRHIGNCYSSINGKHYVGSYLDSSIYQISNNFYNDNENPIISIRTAPHQFDKDEFENIFIDRMIIDIEGGVGDNSYTIIDDTNVIYANGMYYADGTYDAGAVISTTLPPGANPMATLSWSKDFGHSWSNEYPASMGKIGEYSRKLYWRRLGYGKDKVFKLTMTAPVKKIVLGAYLRGGS